MKAVKDIPYVTDECVGRRVLDVYLPDGETQAVFVYFHGGGLEFGDKNGGTVIAEFLANRGIASVHANYRLYPEAKYPEFIDDAAAAVAWVFTNIKSYIGYVPKIFVGGSSAGAYLSMMLAFNGKYLESVGMSPLDIDGFIHDAGQPTTHFNVLRERGIDSRRLIVDEAAPLYHIGTAQKLAPMHFFVSDNDMPARYEQTMTVLATLKHFGIDSEVSLRVSQGTHCEYVYKLDESGDSVFGKMIYEYIGNRK